MRTTDEQVLRLRAERARGRSLEVAAMRAGMHRNTARKSARGPLPSERGVEVADRDPASGTKFLPDSPLELHLKKMIALPPELFGPVVHAPLLVLRPHMRVIVERSRGDGPHTQLGRRSDSTNRSVPRIANPRSRVKRPDRFTEQAHSHLAANERGPLALDREAEREA